MKKNKRILGGVLAICLSLFGALMAAPLVHADSVLSLSPMNEKIILVPGEEFEGDFRVTNPNANNSDVEFEINVSPFYVDEQYNINYDVNGNYNDIVDWVSLDKDSGRLAPNESMTIGYTIDVPKNAPAGGQYVAIIVNTKVDDSGASEGININTSIVISHIIYAEID